MKNCLALFFVLFYTVSVAQTKDTIHVAAFGAQPYSYENGVNRLQTGMSAILIEGDAEGWYESSPVCDVLIKNNVFKTFDYPVLYAQEHFRADFQRQHYCSHSYAFSFGKQKSMKKSYLKKQ